MKHLDNHGDFGQANLELGMLAPDVSAVQLRSALDGVVLAALPLVAAGLSVVYVIFAISHLLILSKNVAVVMALVAITTAIILGGIAVALKRWSISSHWSHPLATCFAGLALLNSILHLYLTGEPRQTTNIIILLIGVGFLFLSTRWFLLVVIASLLGWGLVVLGSDWSSAWQHYGFALFSATILSILVHLIRIRTVRQLERVQQENLAQFIWFDHALAGIKASKETLRATIQAIPDAILRFSADGICQDYQASDSVSLKAFDENLIGLNVNEIFAPFAEQSMLTAIESAFLDLSVQVIEYPYIAGAETFYHEARVVVCGQDEVLCMIRDITERRRAENAIRESEEKVWKLLESASEAIVIIRDDGNILIVNARTEEMFGYDRDDLLGCPVEILVPQRLREVHVEHKAGFFDDPRVRPMGAVIDLTGRHKDGNEFPVEVSLSYVESAGELYAMAYVSDISRRVKAEKELQQYSERLEEMVKESTKQLREAQQQLLKQQRLEQEVELAAQVQASLLPASEPVFEGFDISATARPARYASGDLYDFVVADPFTCFFVLADVSGKGIAAALLAAAARALVRSEIKHSDSPAEILSEVSAAQCGELERAEKFITFLTARLDAEHGSFLYASAGHTEILWWRHLDRVCTRLPATSMPIGIFDSLSITEELIQLRPGDVLALYSDGLTEATNVDGELFGVDRLQELIIANAHLSARDLVETITENVEVFSEGVALADDLTLVVLKAYPRATSFAFPADLEHLGQIVSTIRQFASIYGSDFAYEFELVASELVSNVIKYAYCESSGELRGKIVLGLEWMQLDLYDEGTSFDFSSVSDPMVGEIQEGGFGLFVARQLVDSLEYNCLAPHGNHWQLKKFALEVTSNGWVAD